MMKIRYWGMKSYYSTRIRYKIVIFGTMMMLIFGCGSRKKIVNTNKGSETTQVVENTASSDSSRITSSDSTKTNTNTSEEYSEQITETITFDDKGNLTGYIKSTNRKGTKNSNTEEKKGISKDSTGVSLKSSSTDSTESTEHDIGNSNLTVTPSNPIYKWIGAGLFVLILGAGVALWYKFR